MKVKVVNYTFSPGITNLGYVTFLDYDNIELSSVLLIVNTTDGIPVYSFVDPLLGGTAAGNKLYLELDTSSMSASDSLLVYYDDPVQAPATAGLLADGLGILRRIMQLMKPLQMITGGGSNRLSVDINALPTLSTVTTVTTVTTCNTLGNATNIGGVTAFSLMKDTSRNAYANGIRSKLTFS